MPTNPHIKQPDLKIPKYQDYGKSLQKLRWFRSTFKEQITEIQNQTDIQFKLDSEMLTKCFVEWIQEFEKMKPSHPNQRIAYVGFAAGQMLKKLIVKNPLSVILMPKHADVSSPEYFWSEGFVYVAYCLNARQAVLQNDFDIQIQPSPTLNELATWCSFRENVYENSNYAISFLDLFAGEQPDWSGSGLFNGTERARQLEQILNDTLPKF